MLLRPSYVKTFSNPAFLNRDAMISISFLKWQNIIFPLPLSFLSTINFITASNLLFDRNAFMYNCGFSMLPDHIIFLIWGAIKAGIIQLCLALKIAINMPCVPNCSASSPELDCRFFTPVWFGNNEWISSDIIFSYWFFHGMIRSSFKTGGNSIPTSALVRRKIYFFTISGISSLLFLSIPMILHKL